MFFIKIENRDGVELTEDYDDGSISPSVIVSHAIDPNLDEVFIHGTTNGTADTKTESAKL